MKDLIKLKINDGMIEGYIDQDGVKTFKGIPYAAPPVGELRFCPPQPVEPWSDVKDCTEYGPVAVQSEAGGWKRIPDFIKEKILSSEIMRQLAAEREGLTEAGIAAWTDEYVDMGRSLKNGQMSEDCLSLNVWSKANEGEKLPVFVYIHGGANTSGSGAVEVYTGSHLAQQGIVVVTLNYRLGYFGFLALKDADGEEVRGNMAILDQIAALTWVKNNIAAFGGDPERVTIGGQSAGSGNCQTLMVSPLAKGLFNQSICMSGNSYSRGPFRWKKLEQVQEDNAKLLEGRTIKELRAMSSEEFHNLTSPLGFPMTCIDGEVLTHELVEGYESGNFNHVNMMFGSVDEDCTLFSVVKPLPGEDPMLPMLELSRENYNLKLDNSLGDRAEACRKLYPADDDKENLATDMKKIMIDGMIYTYYQAMKAKEAHDKGINYIYNFSRVVPDTELGMKVNGAFHTGDVGYWFNHFTETYKRPWSEDDYRLGRVMSSYLSNFVKTGNPNGTDYTGEKLPEWTPVNGRDEVSFMSLDAVSVEKTMDSEKANFWKN